jgi:hypothetical protein
MVSPLPVVEVTAGGGRWWRRMFGTPWAWVMCSLAGAAVVAASQAAVSAIALPHLIRLDLAVDDAGSRFSPLYATQGTVWPSAAVATLLAAGSAAGLVALAVVVRRWRRSPRIVLVAANSALLAIGLTGLGRVRNTREERLVVWLAQDLGADRYHDSDYFWYTVAAGWLGLALWVFVLVAAVAGWVLVLREQRINPL